MRESGMTVEVGEPGAYRIAVRSSPYWHASAGCVTAGADKMIRLVTTHSGVVNLTFDVTPGKVLSEMAGRKPQACS
jgi:hypothetical protein